MTESAGLERGYRRLLAAYPQSFRREQEEEMLAVLMAGAPQRRRRPGLAEAADVIRSGLLMRLRRTRPVPDRGWAEALLVVSAAAPLLVVLAGLLEVAVPYPLPPPNRDPELFRWLPVIRELGGLSLLHMPGFDIAVGGQVIIAALVLRRVRWLLRWREGVTLLLTAAAVQVLTLMSDAASDFAQTGVLLHATARSADWKLLPQPGIGGYVAATLALALVAAGLAVTLRISRFFLLLVALCYPIVVELVVSVRDDIDLMGLYTHVHLAVLYLPPLLLVAGIMLVACTGLRLRVVRQPGSA